MTRPEAAPGPRGGVAVLERADPQLVAEVGRGLAAVEERFGEIVRSSHPLLSAASRHLVLAGGKRVRPLMALVAAHLGDPTSPGVVDAAVVVELTHVATLHHDDVMDEAALRHGVPSTNARWSNTVAILTGDFLFARASDLTAGLGTEATHLQSRTFARLVEGQIAETAGPAAGEDPVAHHLRVLADKTASLLATSAQLGAMVAGAPADAVRTVARFGELFGVAFQLSDDLIDIESDSQESGKTPGTDLREGVRTLPVLLALAAPDQSDAPETDAPETDAPETDVRRAPSEPGEAARLRELLSGPLPDDARHAEALALLRRSPALAQARTVLAGYVEQARQVAADLPAGSARDALLSLTDYVAERTG